MIDSEADDGSYVAESDPGGDEDEDGSDPEEVAPASPMQCGLGGGARSRTAQASRSGYRQGRVIVTSLDPKGKSETEIELEELIRTSGSLFSSRGWDIVHAKHDRYLLNGRSLRLFLLPPGIPPADFAHLTQMVGPFPAKKAARIMVNDGPLRQPLLDYLMQTGRNEHYDARGTENPEAPEDRARLIEFGPAGYEAGDRIEAMKAATQQADIRRRAQPPSTNAAQLAVVRMAPMVTR